MFWEPILEKADNLFINYKSWALPEMTIKGESICGIKVKKPNGKEISIICHKYSYGGQDGLFETMPSLDGNEDNVSGYLEADVIIDMLQQIHNDMFKDALKLKK